MERSDSELPLEILQHVLSFLPAEEAVVASLVSKRWLSALSSVPILDFDYSRFQDKLSKERTPCDSHFVEFVNNSLRRHREHDEGICIDKFRLFLVLGVNSNLISSFENWIQILVAKHVKRLSIHLEVPYFSFPQTIFTTNSLVEFVVRGNNRPSFELRLDQVVGKCYTLKILHIDGVQVGNSTITDLSSVFPCLEELNLGDCWCSDVNVKISGLPNLKRFYLLTQRLVLGVKISDAHSLESFTFGRNKDPNTPEPHFLDIFTPEPHYLDSSTPESHYLDISPCHALKHVCLGPSNITDTCFNNLISQCPFIEDLTLRSCTKLKRINVSSCTLKSLTINKVPTLRDVYIDAPNVVFLNFDQVNSIIPVQMVKFFCEAQSLESLTISGLRFGAALLDISYLRVLKHLSLQNLDITDTCFHNLISQCPFLEDLALRSCIKLKVISILSHTLKSLTLSSILRLDEVNIDAPNLIHLVYEGGRQVAPSFSLINSSADLNPIVQIKVFSDISTSFFIELRMLLMQLSPSKLYLEIAIGQVDFEHELKKVFVFDPKLKLESLELCIRRCSLSHASALIEMLLGSCCPATVTLFCDYNNQDAVKFLCEELMDRGRANCCSSDDRIMGWWRDLTHLEAEYSEVSEDEQVLFHQLDWESFVRRSLTRQDRVKIRFSLKWRKV